MNVSKEQALWFYRSMQEQREFELKAYELFRSGKMPGFIHLYVGEEAVAAGVCAARSVVKVLITRSPCQRRGCGVSC